MARKMNKESEATKRRIKRAQKQIKEHQGGKRVLQTREVDVEIPGGETVASLQRKLFPNKVLH